ncbi:SET methyltransferase domain containing protein [Nitzschia inconspicua]|uniref:SET methyltransferase domain containing protein n=1 Tax=Nitzschia inconspicua TaxID=303405 RepID=A0A9K3Q0W3_9STRA|nr:SET methyltransferase domain containing protein [Nitzschia inconspicua]
MSGLGSTYQYVGIVLSVLSLLWIPSINAWTSYSHQVVARHDLRETSASCLQDFVDQLGSVRHCEIGSTEYGRGLVATKDLEPGETILRIPLSATIQIDASQNGDDMKLDDSWAAALANKLMERLQSGSCPYVDSLPPPPPTPARGDWSTQALEALDDSDFLQEIEKAIQWRNRQCERYVMGRLCLDEDSSSATQKNPQLFMEALDLVSSRTIRCGDKFMLVPFLDMANHASQDQGGGYYQLENSPSLQDVTIALKAGNRGVQAGNEVFLDYGDRRNEEWLMYYGFLPDRNTAECVTLPESQQRITWSNVHMLDELYRGECRVLLNKGDTTLTDDIRSLKHIEALEERDAHFELALKYRISRKSLLSAAGGTKSSSALFSSFF